MVTTGGTNLKDDILRLYDPGTRPPTLVHCLLYYSSDCYCCCSQGRLEASRCLYCNVKGKGRIFPYSLPSVGPGADPGVQAVSPHLAVLKVTVSLSHSWTLLAFVKVNGVKQLATSLIAQRRHSCFNPSWTGTWFRDPGGMKGYIPRWYTCPKPVTHPSTNRARRALTSFMRWTPLTTMPTSFMRWTPLTTMPCCQQVARSHSESFGRRVGLG